MKPRFWLGSNDTAAQPVVAAHWPRQSWKVGAKFCTMSLPSMMNPHMVVKLVPSACCAPPSVTQLELAPGNVARTDSVLRENRRPSDRMLAIRTHFEPSKVAPSHFGWNEEQRSAHVVKSKASSVSRTSPSMLVLQSTVNCCTLPIVVPLPLGQGALLFCRGNTAPSATSIPRGNIVWPSLLALM